MPIYEYACTVCGHDFEAIVGVRAPNPECPQCAASTDKKISLSAFHLKGGGWYSDAYAGSDNKQPAGGKSEPSGSTSSPEPSKASDSTSGSSSSSSSSDSGAKPSSSTKSAKPTSSPSTSD
jgi:putative FmdB family regulatory protein